MPATTLNEVTEMRPVDWFAIFFMLADQIARPPQNPPDQQKTMVNAASCYRRAQTFAQVQHLHAKPETNPPQ